MKRKIILYENPDGTTGHFVVGSETLDEVTQRLRQEGKRNIVVLKAEILYWGL